MEALNILAEYTDVSKNTSYWSARWKLLEALEFYEKGLVECEERSKSSSKSLSLVAIRHCLYFSFPSAKRDNAAKRFDNISKAKEYFSIWKSSNFDFYDCGSSFCDIALVCPEVSVSDVCHEIGDLIKAAIQHNETGDANALYKALIVFLFQRESYSLALEYSIKRLDYFESRWSNNLVDKVQIINDEYFIRLNISIKNGTPVDKIVASACLFLMQVRNNIQIHHFPSGYYFLSYNCAVGLFIIGRSREAIAYLKNNVESDYFLKTENNHAHLIVLRNGHPEYISKISIITATIISLYWTYISIGERDNALNLQEQFNASVRKCLPGDVSGCKIIQEVLKDARWLPEPSFNKLVVNRYPEVLK